MPRHRFRSPAEWRRWLEDHHATETEAWVLLSKKADAGLHHEEALEEALCFGWIDGKIRAHDERSFAQRFSPRKEGSVWSEGNRARSGGRGARAPAERGPADATRHEGGSAGEPGGLVALPGLGEFLSGWVHPVGLGREEGGDAETGVFAAPCSGPPRIGDPESMSPDGEDSKVAQMTINAYRHRAPST